MSSCLKMFGSTVLLVILVLQTSGAREITPTNETAVEKAANLGQEIAHDAKEVGEAFSNLFIHSLIIAENLGLILSKTTADFVDFVDKLNNAPEKLPKSNSIVFTIQEDDPSEAKHRFRRRVRVTTEANEETTLSPSAANTLIDFLATHLKFGVTSLLVTAEHMACMLNHCLPPSIHNNVMDILEKTSEWARNSTQLRGLKRKQVATLVKRGLTNVFDFIKKTRVKEILPVKDLLRKISRRGVRQDDVVETAQKFYQQVVSLVKETAEKVGDMMPQDLKDLLQKISPKRRQKMPTTHAPMCTQKKVKLQVYDKKRQLFTTQEEESSCQQNEESSHKSSSSSHHYISSSGYMKPENEGPHVVEIHPKTENPHVLDEALRAPEEVASVPEPEIGNDHEDPIVVSLDRKKKILKEKMKKKKSMKEEGKN